MKFITILISILITGTTNCSPVSNSTDNSGILEMDHIVTIGGRSFYADMSVGKSWEEAMIHCSIQGVIKKKLATILSTAEFEALNNAYDSVKFKGGFWTAAIGSETIFSWADFSVPPPEDVGMPWIIHPIRAQLCAYLNIESRSFMGIDLCTNKRPVLCVSA